VREPIEGPKDNEKPITSHIMERITFPANIWLTIEMVFLERSMPASKNARAGHIPSTSAVETLALQHTSAMQNRATSGASQEHVLSVCTATVSVYAVLHSIIRSQQEVDSQNPCRVSSVDSARRRVCTCGSGYHPGVRKHSRPSSSVLGEASLGSRRAGRRAVVHV
jgi:hypothetical protein